jgi:hypothetical protein
MATGYANTVRLTLLGMSASCSLDELARFLRLAWIWGILMASSGLVLVAAMI